MSPRNTNPKLTWKPVNIQERLNTLSKTIKQTKRQTSSNKTRLLTKIERWQEQIEEINEGIRRIKKIIIQRLEKELNLKMQSKKTLLAAMFQPSTKNLFLELETQYRRKNNPFDDDGFYELISLSEAAKKFALLGDAAISMAVIYYLWNSNDENVGELTQDKSSIVSNRHMARLCDRWGLYKHRIHFDPEIPSRGEILHDKGTLVEAVYGIIQMEHGFGEVLNNIGHLL